MFYVLITQLRRNELINVRRTNNVKAFNMGFCCISTVLLSFLMFLPYKLSGHMLTADRVFTIISCISLVNYNITMFFPNAVTDASQLRVTFARLEAFLRHSSLSSVVSLPTSASNNFNKDDDKNITNNAVILPDDVVVVDDISCSWMKIPVLCHISFRIPRGTMLAIAGPVGSGMLSFYYMLLSVL